LPDRAGSRGVQRSPRTTFRRSGRHRSRSPGPFQQPDWVYPPGQPKVPGGLRPRVPLLPSRTPVPSGLCTLGTQKSETDFQLLLPVGQNASAPAWLRIGGSRQWHGTALGARSHIALASSTASRSSASAMTSRQNDIHPRIPCEPQRKCEQSLKVGFGRKQCSPRRSRRW
jgi:hypothetical protein